MKTVSSQSSKAKLFLFGAEVHFKPSYDRQQERLHKYGDKTLPGIFVGYAQLAGGQWQGDYLVAEWSEIENADTAREIHVHQIKECIPLKSVSGNFYLSFNLWKTNPTTRWWKTGCA